MSSSSRQPGASSSSTGPTERWSATANDAQLADLVAPELDAHGVLGGGREDVDDAAADRELAARGDHLDPRVGQLDQALEQRVEVVAVPTRSRTGSSRPRPGAIGWIRLRAAATTTRGAVSGVASRRKIDSRRPTVSERGESRSCGRVSQLGSTATASAPSRSAAAAPRSSASRSVAVTARTVRAAPAGLGQRGGEERPQRGRALDAQGGDLGCRHVTGGVETARRSGSVREERSRPETAWPRFGLPLAGRAHADRPLPRDGAVEAGPGVGVADTSLRPARVPRPCTGGAARDRSPASRPPRHAVTTDPAHPGARGIGDRGVSNRSDSPGAGAGLRGGVGAAGAAREGRVAGSGGRDGRAPLQRLQRHVDGPFQLGVTARRPSPAGVITTSTSGSTPWFSTSQPASSNQYA